MVRPFAPKTAQLPDAPPTPLIEPKVAPPVELGKGNTDFTTDDDTSALLWGNPRWFAAASRAHDAATDAVVNAARCLACCAASASHMPFTRTSTVARSVSIEAAGAAADAAPPFPTTACEKDKGSVEDAAGHNARNSEAKRSYSGCHSRVGPPARPSPLPLLLLPLPVLQSAATAAPGGVSNAKLASGTWG